MPIGHEDVDEAIVVIVEKAGPPSEKGNRRFRNAGTEGDIAKISVPIISIQGVVIIREVRDIQIDFAVAIVVAYGNSHRGLLARIPIDGESGQITYVLKGAIVAVAIEVLGNRVVRDHQIDPTIIINVDEHGGKTVIAPSI